MAVGVVRSAGTLLAVAVCAAAAQEPGRSPVASFERRAAAYAEMQRDISRSLPPLEITHDSEKIFAAVSARRAAIRRARAGARPGDILTPEAAPVLVGRIRAALGGVGMTTGDLLRALADDSQGYARAEVNATFSWTTAAGMPPCILMALPPLPEMLEYRFVGPDLVLIDIDASLILDVVRDALTGGTD